jgi:beta-lactamase regulating signal transducer with metallopeptidase domain
MIPTIFITLLIGAIGVFYIVRLVFRVNELQAKCDDLQNKVTEYKRIVDRNNDSIRAAKSANVPPVS